LFSLKWAGLDHTGAPQGILNGEVSKDYSAITNSRNRDDLVYNGPRTPKMFGSFVNTFSWKKFELSFMISYKTGYVLNKAYSLGNPFITNVSWTSSPEYGLR